MVKNLKNKKFKISLILTVAAIFLFTTANIISLYNYNITIPPINYNNMANEINIPKEEILDLTTNDANNPNLTRVGYPIIIQMIESPYIFNALEGLNESHIRILYYNTSNQWIEVPFQIDEKGWILTWQNGPILNYSYTYVSQNGSNNYEPTDPYGRDTGLQIPYAIDYDDEICFYAENGKWVPSTVWWNESNFPYRININITDPVDGGQSFMYIYYNNETGQGIPLYESYVNWDPSNLTITTQTYQTSFDAYDPDIRNLLRILSPSSDGMDILEEGSKSFGSVQINIPIFGTFHLDLMTHGNWSGIYYNGTACGIDNPNEEAIQLSSPDPSNTRGWVGWDTEGDRLAIKNGPIRVILLKQTYIHVGLTVFSVDVDVYIHATLENHFYNNMEQTSETKIEIDLPEVGLSVTYDPICLYLETIRINSSIRDDFSAVLGGNPGGYPGYTPGDANPNYTISNEKYLYFNGSDTDDDLQNGGNPTLDPGQVPPASNEGLPDYVMVASQTHGGFWAYLPRKEFVDPLSSFGTTPYMYYNDISSYTELGVCGGGITASEGDLLATEPYNFRFIYDMFDNVSDLERAKLEYRRYKTDLLLNVGIISAINNTAPSIILNSPMNATVINKPAYINLTITDDNLNSSSVEWKANVTQTSWTNSFIGSYDIGLSSFTSDQVIQFWIRASDIVGTQSSITIILTFDDTSPTKPTNPAITIQQGNITLSWTASSDNNVVFYQIWRNGLYLGNTTLNYYRELENLSHGKYKYEIIPVDEANNTGEALIIKFRIIGPIKLPPFLFPPPDNGKIIIIIILGIVGSAVCGSSVLIIRKRRNIIPTKGKKLKLDKRKKGKKGMSLLIPRTKFGTDNVAALNSLFKNLKEENYLDNFKQEITVVSNDELKRILQLNIFNFSDITLILEELANLNPKKRRKLIEALENFQDN